MWPLNLVSSLSIMLVRVVRAVACLSGLRFCVAEQYFFGCAMVCVSIHQLIDLRLHHFMMEPKPFGTRGDSHGISATCMWVIVIKELLACR